MRTASHDPGVRQDACGCDHFRVVYVYQAMLLICGADYLVDATILVVVILLLLVANAFFVATEFALVKTRVSRMHLFADEGRNGARLVLRVQRNLEAYLTACQLGATLASLGFGWVGGALVASLLQRLVHPPGAVAATLDTIVVIIGLLLLSSLHFVVGRQLPRNTAVHHAESVSLRIAYPLHLAYLVLFPLTWLLSGASDRLMGLFGDQTDYGEVTGSDNKEHPVELPEDIDAHEQEWVDKPRSASEQDRRTIAQVMVPRERVHTLDLARHPDENLLVICEDDHFCFPVVDSANRDQIVGVLYARDFFNAMLDSDEDPWRDLRRYCSKPPVVPPSRIVSELSEYMRTKRAHMALVADASGTLVGIVTPSDLAERDGAEVPDDRGSTPETSNLRSAIGRQ